MYNRYRRNWRANKHKVKGERKALQLSKCDFVVKNS
jgi:hypothetical protein